MFNTIKEVYDWLYTQKKITKREDLSRIKKCIEELNIVTNYKIIHVAGTNGKGSTCSYLKNILKNTMKRVGLFVSPYVISFNERIEVNDRYISDAEIMYYANLLYTYSNEYKHKYNDVIPFFELTLLMALMYFTDRQIDIAIIECGLGGLLDATNILNTNLAIITNIGYDHMSVLGNTLEEIANQKLGIIKENMTALCCVKPQLKQQFKDYCLQKHAKIIFVDEYVSDIYLDNKTHFEYKNEKFSTSLLGIYQAYNASLAIEAARFIDSSINDNIIQSGLEETFWPGRMEVVSSNPRIILDGAHNIDGIEALVETMNSLKDDKKIKVIFSALHDKAYDKMLNCLDNIADFYYFTTIVDTRASYPNEFLQYTAKPSKVINNIEMCLSEAIQDLKENEILLVTGSLHFISIVREKINNFLKK